MTPEQLITQTRLESRIIKDMHDNARAEIDDLISQAETAALNGDAGRAARLLIQTATLRKVLTYGQ